MSFDSYEISPYNGTPERLFLFTAGNTQWSYNNQERDIIRGSVTYRPIAIAMDNIVQQVAQMHHLMQEISQASQEQSMGLEQIGAAVSQLDAVTQQNTALVEQSTSVAGDLQQQSARLAQLLAPFRIG